MPFARVVARYFDFVHAVAVRRLGADFTHALDVTQTVFIDLALKAHKLRDDSQLGGWLHHHTCFVAAKFIRSETRRVLREKHAAQMQSSGQTTDDPWTIIAPIIDEAIHDLADQDRSAILLRYFEGRDLRSVGKAFRISEDAAQKRVQRALERLKSLLQQKGIAVSTITLASVLTVHASPAVASAPVNEISVAATTKHETASGFAQLLNAKTAVAVAVVLAAILLLVRPPLLTLVNRSNTTDAPDAHSAAATVIPNTGSALRTDSQPASLQTETPSQISAANKDTLVIRVIDASTKQPVPAAKVRISMGRPPQPGAVFVEGDILLIAGEKGVAHVPLANTRKDRLMLQTYAENYADWLSIWDISKGEAVPAEYTVALEPGVPLGGRVLDENGNPVPGAQVRFGTRGSTAKASQQIAIRPLTNITDATGAWLDTHMPESFLNAVVLNVSHPDFVKTNLSPNSSDLADMRARTFAIKLAKGINVTGRVTTSNGDPVTNALVSYGRPSYVYRVETGTDVEGRYTLKNISPDGLRFEKSFAVVAPSYAVASQKFVPAVDSNELNFVLEPGRIIRGRVVNKVGEPLGNVRVIRNRDDGIDWYMITADDGRFFWNGAPDSPQSFYFGVPGYVEIRERLLTPQDDDYEIVLDKPQIVKGTATDATTGLPIPVFFATRSQASTNRPIRDDFDEYEFKNGRFEFPVGNSAYNMIRVRAPGYMTAHFKISADNKVTAELQPARTLQGIVLDSQGRPIARVEVAAVPIDTRQPVRIGKGRLVIDGTVDQTRSDESGRFKLSLSAESRGIVAVHPSGIAESSLAAFESTNALRLLPWARVEGTLVSNRIPLPNQEIAIQSGGLTPLDYRDFKRATTGQDGRFTFDLIPPRGLLIHHQRPIDRTHVGPGIRSAPIPAQTNFAATPGAVTYIELDSANPPTFGTNAVPAP